MHLYHYCAVSGQDGATLYQSGTVQVENKVKTNNDYADLVKTVAKINSKEIGDFVITSLSLLHAEVELKSV